EVALEDVGFQVGDLAGAQGVDEAGLRVPAIALAGGCRGAAGGAAGAEASDQFAGVIVDGAAVVVAGFAEDNLPAVGAGAVVGNFDRFSIRGFADEVVH